MVFYFQRSNFRLLLDGDAVFPECVERHMVGCVIADNSALGTIEKRPHGIGAFAAGGNKYFADNLIGEF